jgi:hypothetical protein
LGEPFHLDAVFHDVATNIWFPIEVALEHENDPRTFIIEVRKLLSMRCPLKVGVTYTLKSDIRNGNLEELRGTISDRISYEYKIVSDIIAESPTTEYLFLVGSEDRECEIDWYSLAFNARVGPQNSRFTNSYSG